MNSLRPSFCAGERALVSPLRKRSNAASGVISVASNTAMAFCTLLSVIEFWLAWKCFGKRITIARSPLQLLGYMRFG